jgi:hypothetical protein
MKPTLTAAVWLVVAAVAVAAVQVAPVVVVVAAALTVVATTWAVAVAVRVAPTSRLLLMIGLRSGTLGEALLSEPTTCLLKMQGESCSSSIATNIWTSGSPDSLCICTWLPLE